MIDNLVFFSPKYVSVSCTYCWQAHRAIKRDSKLFLTGSCGHDPRRYFLNHADYIAYVRRYEAEGNRHINEWGGRQERLPLFEGVASG